jgi:hypothetical protein
MRKSKKFLNPEDLLSQIISSDFDLSQFDQIDESHIPQPPNFIDWITGRDFCNATLLPWQVEAGMHLFSDYCPECSNPEYITELFDESMAEILDNIQFLDQGVCPKCKKNRLDLFTLGEKHPTKPSIKSEFIGNLGQRSGKTLAEHTEVLTPQGPVAIKDIQIGDIVYGWNRDGSVSETKVVNKFDHGIKPVRDLISRGRVLASCTDEHRWLTCRTSRYGKGTRKQRKSDFLELKLKDFKDNKDIAIHRKLIKIPCGEVSEPHAYAIAALLGDGCSRQGTSNTIDISSGDQNVPKKVASVLGAQTIKRNWEDNYTWHIRAGDTYSRETLNCHYYAEWCKGKYAHEKICDLETIKTWDRESCLEFLAGLIDTDGSVHGTGRLIVAFGCQSRSVVEAFAYLVYRLFQYKPAIHMDNRPKYFNGPIYQAKVNSTFFAKRILKEIDPYLASPNRKWKPEYEMIGNHNSHSDYTKPQAGEPYLCQTYDIEVGNETNLYVLAHEGLITHNSKMVALSTSYQLNRWLSLHDPLGFYGLPRMEVILGTFSALSAEQAEENLWMPFKGLIDASPWFKKYNDFLKSEEKRLSIPLCDVKDTYMFYPHKRLLISFTGSDDRKKRGRTRLFGAIDEIAFLNSEVGTSKKKVMDADKNYAALNNSLSTIRQKALMRLAEGHFNTIMPIMYNASSPYNVQDKIMRLTKSAPDNPFAVVIHRATWESNPDYSEKTCRAINPGLSQVEFERDFGAIPPFSDSPYIGDARVMEKLCAHKDHYRPLLNVTREVHVDMLGDKYLFLRAKAHQLDKNTPRLLALDNGYNQNAFGAAIFGYDSIQKKPVLQFLVSLYPDPQSNLSIHFPSMFENFILPIIQGLNIKHVFYDRWQSLDQIQRLRDMKINAEAHSLSFEKDMLPFKQQLLSGNMVLPPLEIASMQEVKDAVNPTQMTTDKPVANLIWQTLTVRQVGKKVLKPLDGDDDLFRAFVLGGSRFLSDEIQRIYATYAGIKQAAQNAQGFLGSFHSRSGGGSSATPNRGNQISIAKYRGFSK